MLYHCQTFCNDAFLILHDCDNSLPKAIVCVGYN